MPKLNVEVTNYGRAFIWVVDSSDTYSYDRDQGFRDGKGTHIPMWMQGARNIDSFEWDENYPFPNLQEKIERIGKVGSFKCDVAVVIDTEISIDLRKRALARVARMLADSRYDDAVSEIDWSKELFPKDVIWDIVPENFPVSDIFAKVREIVEHA